MAGRLSSRPARAVFAIALAAALSFPVAASGANCEQAPGGGLTLANVATEGGRVRIVGSNGLLARSSALGRWRIEATPNEHALRGVVWTGKRWVAVGDLGTILHRQGTEWLAAEGIPPVGLRGIAARPGLVAASGNNGTVVTSPDGVAWQQVDSGTESILWGGTAVGSELWLSGQESTVIRSADGANWSQVPAFPAPTDSTAAPRPFLWQLAAAGGEVVAVGDFGAVLQGSAADGLSAVESPTDEILRGVSFARGRWVAVGSGGKVLHSEDGRRWRLGTAPTTVDLRGVAFDGSDWVAVGDQSTVIASPGGRHWRVEVSAMPCALLGLAAGSKKLVAVGGGGRVLLSADGREWRRAPRPTTQDLYGVTRGHGTYVAVGAGGTILTSGDGRRWSERESPTPLNLHTVHWTGEEFLAGGDRGRVLSSDDARRWRRVPFPGFHSVRGFATDGSSVVAAGAGTIALRPPGGSDWQLEQLGFARFQTAVAYGAGRFVIVGHNGEALVSTDGGETWTAGTSGVEVNLDAIVWTGERFLATGEGTAISSEDGLTWEAVALPTARSVRALAPFGAEIVGVGDGGTRVHLPNGFSPGR